MILSSFEHSWIFCSVHEKPNLVSALPKLIATMWNPWQRWIGMKWKFFLSQIHVQYSWYFATLLSGSFDFWVRAFSIHPVWPKIEEFTLTTVGGMTIGRPFISSLELRCLAWMAMKKAHWTWHQPFSFNDPKSPLLNVSQPIASWLSSIFACHGFSISIQHITSLAECIT